MSDLPTLIVDNASYAARHQFADPIRIDGDLPTVRCCAMEGTSGWCRCLAWERGTRPLRVGDRVTLATMQPLPDTPHHPVPFATATVTDIDSGQRYVNGYWLVTVTDVGGPVMSDEWTDLDWTWDALDEEIVVDEVVACSLENPETCEACD